MKHKVECFKQRFQCLFKKDSCSPKLKSKLSFLELLFTVELDSFNVSVIFVSITTRPGLLSSEKNIT